MKPQADRNTVVPSCLLFLWLYSIATIWHHTTQPVEIQMYWFQFDAIQTPLVFAAIFAGLLLALKPRSTHLFFIFVLVQVLVFVTRMPKIPAHMVMEGFFAVGMAVVLVRHAIANGRRDSDQQTMFVDYRPLGKWLLIAMYFYGTFHKLNSGFFNPDSSCAVMMASSFPLPFNDQLWFEYFAIYGTLIVEATAMVLLFSSRFKYYGMLMGILFHLIIGIAPSGQIAHFSALALALHALFLPDDAAQKFSQDERVPGVLKTRYVFLLITIVICALQVLFAILKTGFLMNLLFGIFGFTLFVFVFRYGGTQNTKSKNLVSKVPLVNLLSVLFVLHCAGPYIGLNTYGVVAMFSGLRTEGGISNHYIVGRPFYVFPYQKKVAYFEDTRAPYLEYLMNEGQGLTVDALQQHFVNLTYPLYLPLTVRVNDSMWRVTNVTELNAMTDDLFVEHNAFERFYLSFRLVDDPQPKKCRH
jgi:hypothetical protein